MTRSWHISRLTLASTQWMTIANNRFWAPHSVCNSWEDWQQDDSLAARRQSCSVYNNCSLMPSRTWGNICTYFVPKTQISPQGASGGGSECSNRICYANFLMVFHSNCGSILLSFQDMTTWLQPSHIWPLRQAATMILTWLILSCTFTGKTCSLLSRGVTSKQ